MKASAKSPGMGIPSRSPESKAADIVVIHVGKESLTWRTLRKEMETVSTWAIEWKRASDVAEAARESRVIQVAAGSGERPAHAEALVSLEMAVRDVDIPILMGLLVDGVPVIAAKGAINDAIWMLKSEAIRFDLPFEVAESWTSFSHLVKGSIDALVTARAGTGGWRQVGRRIASSHPLPAEPEVFAKLLAVFGRWLRNKASSTDASSLQKLLEKWLQRESTESEQTTVIRSSDADDSERDVASAKPSRSDVLGTLPGVVAATRELRAESGRLHADKISELFGMSRVELARLAGVTAEAIRQTPDSARLQPTLSVLDRCARLLVLNPEKANFRAWLNTQNPELGDQTPLEAIKGGRIEMVADLVEDVLTNRGG